MGHPKEPVRVVVTGVGAVTAQGRTAKEFWEGVKAGRVAIREVKRVPMEGFRTRIAGEVQTEVKPAHDYNRPEDYRDPVIDFALKAAEEAMASSGAEAGKIAPERWGVV
ncbi:MAG: 3-ketoacyl-ACP synthase, partial [Gemmatimonadetes bacterium]